MIKIIFIFCAPGISENFLANIELGDKLGDKPAKLKPKETSEKLIYFANNLSSSPVLSNAHKSVNPPT